MHQLLAQNLLQDQGEVLFWIFALLTGGSALGVAFLRNIVRMALCLMFTLTGVAGLYFLLSAEFLAAVQLVVYAGGTLILIIFGVMLTNKLPSHRLKPRKREVAIAVILAAVMMSSLFWGIHSVFYKLNPINEATHTLDKLGVALLGEFLVPFEMVSVVLLGVMIGAAYLAKGRKHDEEEKHD